MDAESHFRLLAAAALADRELHEKEKKALLTRAHGLGLKAASQGVRDPPRTVTGSGTRRRRPEAPPSLESFW